MKYERLSAKQSEIVGKALFAAVDGPFFPEWEFSTLFGLSREDVKQVAEQWPVPILDPDLVKIAVNNSLLNLVGYPHRQEELLPEWVSATKQELAEILKILRGGGKNYFDMLM